LITESAQKIDTTVQGIDKVRPVMHELVIGMSVVAANMESIADISARQAVALGEVVVAVGDLDKVTNMNAALVERTAHRSNRLTERSQEMLQAVKHMKLREGTADEALALVSRAVEHMRSVGYDQAVRDFQNHEGSFLDRDLYIFVLDRAGTYHVMGANQDKVGTSVIGAVVEGEDFVNEVWRRADQGGGWTDYHVANPVNGQVRAKCSYVFPLSDELLIGCGAYRSGVQNFVAEVNESS
jgi:signal transduction histidine kinase